MKNQRKLSDTEIIQLFQSNGRQIYLGLLYDRYVSKVYGTCLSYVRDEHKAEDLTQDIFLKICTKLHTFGNRSTFSTWLFAITRNYCIDFLRKAKKDKMSYVENFNDRTNYLSYNMEEDLDSHKNVPKITKEKLDEIFTKIKKDEKDIILLKYQEQRSIKEIQQMLNISMSAAKMRIKRAKDKVRKHYQQELTKPK